MTLLLGTLLACSDSGVPVSTGAAPQPIQSCAPECNPDQICFSSSPADAAPPASCRSMPVACASTPSCTCLEPNVCPGGYDYCSYDALVGYIVLQCSP